MLKAVQAHPAAWSRVDAVLERSASQQSKFFALQVRERREWGEEVEGVGKKGVVGRALAPAPLLTHK